MKLWLCVLILGVLAGCEKENKQDTISFETLDTDFSKGRLKHKQTHTLQDLEKFHGHICDGLVVAVLAIREGMNVLYPRQPIDRTNLRIVSKPAPCLADAAAYMTGARYQYGSFYIDTAFDGLFVIQRKDNQQTVSVAMNPGIKPPEIDRLGNLAIKKRLSPCGLDSLRVLEDQFIADILRQKPADIFTVTVLENFRWQPNTQNNHVKTDIINKNMPACSGQ